MPRSVHHVNLSVPEDGAQTEADWLVAVLGYREVTGGPEITEIVEKMGRRLWWFEADDGSQVHLSPNPAHAIVPMTGMTMLTTAHTNAAIANGSTRASPQPPGPPGPPAPVGSGSGPTGTALVSSGFQAWGSWGGSEADIRGTLPTPGHELVSPR